MVKTKTKIYPAPEEKPMEIMVEIAQNTIKELGMAIKTQYLDKTLVEVIGEGPPGSLLKKNIVTVYQEGGDMYIKFKSQMMDSQRFWDLFETNMDVFGTSTEQIEDKAKVVSKIIAEISNMGAEIVEDDAWDFLLNFEKSYKRLPEDAEIKSIALSFVRMYGDDDSSYQGEDEDDAVFVGEDEETVIEDEFSVTPEEALIGMIKEMKSLPEDKKKYFISLFPDLTLEEQKKLVTRIRAIESDIDKIPHLTQEERDDIRDDVMGLSTEKRRTKILKIIKKRSKNLAFYANKAMEGEIRDILNRYNFLSDLEKDIYIGMMEQFNVEDKKKFIKRIKIVEDLLVSIGRQNVKISEIEKRSYRDELMRLGKKGREKRIEEILEEKKYDEAKEELFKEIPSMRFEDHEKIVKELMWLNPDEKRARINKLKSGFLDETSKKAKTFEESKAGSSCPDCGWPIGTFSKKCPRCGKQFGFTI